MSTFTTPSSAERIKATCRRVEAMLLAKNERYHDSALNPLRIFSTGSPSEQLRVRIDDKISRMRYTGKEDEDVILDLVGYLVLLLIAEAGDD